MAKYLVTGGCGFIGSHLVDKLLSDGHRLVVIDDLSTGKKENISGNVELIIADIRNKGVFDDVLKSVDGVFHLAAIASVMESVTNWRFTHEVNATAIVNLYEAISNSDKNIPVVYASSAAVYGDSESFPFRESLNVEPISAYGADKYACELYSRVANKVHSIPSIGLRFFNVYGSRQDPSSPYSGVISIFAEKVLSGDDVIIFGNGKQARDFIYVDDVVRAIILSMEKMVRGKAGFDVYNVCAGKITTINQLLDVVESVANVSVNRIHESSRKGEVKISYGDGSRAVSEIGFKSSVSLEEGLKSTMEYINNVRAKNLFLNKNAV